MSKNQDIRGGKKLKETSPLLHIAFGDNLVAFGVTFL